MVTVTLPPYAQPGSQIDVTISAVGDATTLQGGVLLMSGLKGPDGQVYAVAQGPLVMGGYVAGGGGNSTAVNHPTVDGSPTALSSSMPRRPLRWAHSCTCSYIRLISPPHRELPRS